MRRHGSFFSNSYCLYINDRYKYDYDGKCLFSYVAHFLAYVFIVLRSPAKVTMVLLWSSKCVFAALAANPFWPTELNLSICRVTEA